MSAGSSNGAGQTFAVSIAMQSCGARTFDHALTGAAAGAAAAWAMSRFGRAWVRVFHAHEPRGLASDARSADDRDAEAVAQAAARHLLRREPSRSELTLAVPLVRYGLGGATGAMYALALGPRYSGVTAGTLVGLSLWVCAELSRAPAFGMPPARWTDSSARESLASHIVYGLTLDVLNRRLSRLIP
jgi:hypothetical protein